MKDRYQSKGATAQALLTALRDGAAPGLISLNLRGNQLSDAATSSLVRSCCCMQDLYISISIVHICHGT